MASERKKTFEQVGVRNVKVDRIEEHEVPDMEGKCCPFCGGGPLDGVTGASFDTIKDPSGPWDVVELSDHKIEPVFPEDGSPTICAYCGELCAFRKDEGGKLTIVMPTASDLAEWNGEPDLWRVLSNLQDDVKAKALERRLSGDIRYAKSKPRRF